jgi:hypothetical protein
VRALVPVVAALAVTFTPAWSYLPASLRATLAKESGGTLYLPARSVGFYRYRSGAAVRRGVLTVEFRDRVRIRAGLWKWTNKTFVWQVRPYTGPNCRAWGNAAKTLQMGGNKVYWAPNQAWRCVEGHVLAAIDDSGRLPDVALGRVAASGLDVAGR